LCMQALQILRAHALRQTKCRVEVLQYFLRASQAQTHADLEASLPAYDRVTLYRTLNTFEQLGILHRVMDETAVLKYALSQRKAPHAHFRCERCQTTTCMDVAVPAIALKPGYEVHQQALLLTGICPHCSQAGAARAQLRAEV